jgi:acyl carrier protein
VDAMVHLAGFLLNGNLAKPTGDIYISNHIGSLHVLADLTASTKQVCTCFATIREQTTKGAALCDVYVYDDESLIASCTNIRFQKLNREVFASMVAKMAGHPAAAAASRPSQTQAAGTTDDGETGLDDGDAHGQDWTQRTPVSSAQPSGLAERLLGLIAHHTGIDAAEIGPSSKVADMGIDSLMAIAIIADFEMATSVKLPAAFFSGMETVADIEDVAQAYEELGGEAASGVKPAAMASLKTEIQSFRTASTSKAADGGDVMSAPVATGKLPDVTTVGIEGDSNIAGKRIDSPIATHSAPVQSASWKIEAETSVREARQMSKETAAKEKTNAGSAVARIFLIQGKAHNQDRPLFLITDGSGSVCGYIHLTPLPGGRKIYAVESPFVERPMDYTLTIPEMAQVFMRAIRREQPRGKSGQMCPQTP